MKVQWCLEIGHEATDSSVGIGAATPRVCLA